MLDELYTQLGQAAGSPRLLFDSPPVTAFSSPLSIRSFSEPSLDWSCNGMLESTGRCLWLANHNQSWPVQKHKKCCAGEWIPVNWELQDLRKICLSQARSMPVLFNNSLAFYCSKLYEMKDGSSLFWAIGMLTWVFWGSPKPLISVPQKRVHGFLSLWLDPVGSRPGCRDVGDRPSRNNKVHCLWKAGSFKGYSIPMTKHTVSSLCEEIKCWNLRV